MKEIAKGSLHEKKPEIVCFFTKFGTISVFFQGKAGNREQNVIEIRFGLAYTLRIK